MNLHAKSTRNASLLTFLSSMLVSACAELPADEAPEELASTSQAVTLSTFNCQSASETSDFYAWSGTLPSNNGEVIRCRPLQDYADDAPVRGYRVLYRTSLLEHRAGYDVEKAVAASGLVWVPRGATTRVTRPVIANTHGAVGVIAKCGPSKTTGYDREFVNRLAEGLPETPVVVVPDYVGLGFDAKLRVDEKGYGVWWPNNTWSYPFSDISHPFVSLEGEGRATVDLVRAARQLPNSQLSAGPVQWVAFGQSQGGHAALATAEVMHRQDYATDSEVQLLGVVAGAPSTELYQDAWWNDALKYPLFAMIAAALPLEWREVRASDFVTPEAIRLIGNSVNGTCLAQTTVQDLLAFNIVKLWQPGTDPFKDAKVKRALTAISPGKAPTSVPIFVGQVLTDPFVQAGRTRAYIDNALPSYKANVTYCEYYGGGARNDAEQWVYERLGWLAHIEDHNAFQKMFANASRRRSCRRNGGAIDGTTPIEFVRALPW